MNPELDRLLKQIEAAGGPVRIFPDPNYGNRSRRAEPTPGADLCYGIVAYAGDSVEDWSMARDWDAYSDGLFIHRLKTDALARGYLVNTTFADSTWRVQLVEPGTDAVSGYAERVREVNAWAIAWLEAFGGEQADE